jgi:hypothetical protein
MKAGGERITQKVRKFATMNRKGIPPEEEGASEHSLSDITDTDEAE